MEDVVMIGRLLRGLVIWPIPPRYSGPAVATPLLTVALLAVAQIHSLAGVAAAAIGAAAFTFGLRALCRVRQRPA
jgi:hypothetical protein